MTQKSAGILMYRVRGSELLVLLVHPGGPFWAKKDEAAWSIPKGLYVEGEDPLAAAKREFQEETGSKIDGQFIELGDFKQPSGKLVSAWGVEGEFDLCSLQSNTFSMEWPPKSGRQQEFPEVDKAGWFKPSDAMLKILKGQRPILEKLLAKLGAIQKMLPLATAACHRRRSHKVDKVPYSRQGSKLAADQDLVAFGVAVAI